MVGAGNIDFDCFKYLAELFLHWPPSLCSACSLNEVRNSPHGIFGSCTQYPRGLVRWAELLGRRRGRRQLVLPGDYRPPDPPPCLISRGVGLHNVRSHTRMLGPSAFQDSQVIPECLVLQYSQIHRSYQNGGSFSISRFTGPQTAWSSDAQKYKFRHPTQAI